MKKELLKGKLETIKNLFDKYTIEELVNTYNDIDEYEEKSINNFVSIALDSLEQLAENNRREKAEQEFNQTKHKYKLYFEDWIENEAGKIETERRIEWNKEIVCYPHEIPQCERYELIE